MKRLFVLIVLGIQLDLSAQMLTVCADTSIANQAVFKAAKSASGRKVARGECWDLVQFALNQAHCKWDGYLNFGNKIILSNSCLQVGDILQFDHVQFSGIAVNGLEYTEQYAHHFAIIYSLKSDGTIQLIHQNTGQFGRKVGISTIHLKDKTQGEITFFRPTLN